MSSYLWGDNFYDEEKNKFVKYDKDSQGKKLKRCFVKLIIDLILELF